MLEGAMVGVRLAAVSSSVVLHASIVVTVFATGHSPSTDVSRLADTLEVATVEIVAPELDAPAQTPATSEVNRATATPHRTHSHPYPVPLRHDLTPHDPSLVHAPLTGVPMARADEPAAASEVLTTSTKQPSFVIVVGPAAVASGGPSTHPGGSAPSGGEGSPIPESGVDSPARLLSGGVPTYSPEATEAAIEADVPLEIVVDAGGRVRSARVLKHVGYGLDAAAERAVRSYRFAPAIRQGHATAVRMKWTMLFRLH